MKKDKKGISLIALIIIIAVIIIMSVLIIQNGLQRTEEAKLAKHNQNISMTQEEVENYYYYKGTELPVVNLTPYTIAAGTSLYNEIAKNGEQADNFYVLDMSKLGKTAGKEGNGVGDDIYIVSSTRHNIYYVRGDTIKNVTYHGLITKNDIKLAQITGSSTSTPTVTAGATPTNTPTPTSTPSYAYNNPIIPTGFNKVGTETWDNGFTIQDDSNSNQFVWVPVGNLIADGTLDDTNFNSRLGRRTFGGPRAAGFYETNDTVLQNITASVNTYGGFYIAKYEASNNTGKAESKANKAPWVSISWADAKAAAEAMDAGWNTSAVESYLCYGAHWDTALEWLYESGNKSLAQINSNSSSWGNYSDDTFSGTTGIGTTGQWNQTCAKGIYDLAGNVLEYTMENKDTTYHADRGGYYGMGGTYSAFYRDYWDSASTMIGFRTVLYVH